MFNKNLKCSEFALLLPMCFPNSEILKELNQSGFFSVSRCKMSDDVVVLFQH